jgi:general secretion pathway protein A
VGQCLGQTRQRTRAPELLPLGSRIRRRHHVYAASRDELCACLDHVLEVAGNPSLMSSELRATLAEHALALGNHRILMNMADELLAVAVERELPGLDDKLFLEVFQQPQRTKSSAPTRKR